MRLTLVTRTCVGLLVVGLLCAAAPVSTSARFHRKVVIYDLFRPGLVKPKRLFLSADTPYVIFGLLWKHWGSERAVAHGHWDGLNCGPCGPNPIRVKTPVIVTAEHLIKCKPGLYAYRTVLLTVPSSKARAELSITHKTTNIGLGGCL